MKAAATSRPARFHIRFFPARRALILPFVGLLVVISLFSDYVNLIVRAHSADAGLGGPYPFAIRLDPQLLFSFCDNIFSFCERQYLPLTVV